MPAFSNQKYLWPYHLHGIVRHHQSFIGKDFKALKEMAPFVLLSYLNKKNSLAQPLQGELLNFGYNTMMIQTFKTETDFCCNLYCEKFTKKMFHPFKGKFNLPFELCFLTMILKDCVS